MSALTIRRSETTDEMKGVYDVFDDRGFLGHVWKQRFTSPRTNAVGIRWYFSRAQSPGFEDETCPEWGFVRRKQAAEAFVGALEAAS